MKNQKDKISTQKKENLYIIILLALNVISTLLLFDAKVSIGGDDALYIQRAHTFINSGEIPGYQGSLYPMFLAIIISIFGLNLIALKVFSIIFNTVGLYLIYRALRSDFNRSAIFAMLIIMVINSSFLYFGSQTYTEAFFTMIIGIFLLVFKRYHSYITTFQYNVKNDWKGILFISFCAFLVYLTKNIGLTAIVSLVFLLLVKKRWKQAILFFISFLLFVGIFTTIRYLTTEKAEIQIASQGSNLLQKHPYDASQGKEDISGFINRFFENSNQYFSKQFLTIIGLQKETNYDQTPIIALLLWLILILGSIRYYKKNEFIFFIYVFASITFAVIFVVLHTFWKQERMIITFVPILLVLLLQLLFDFSKKANFKWLNIVTYILISIFIISSFSKTIKKISKNIPALNHYLKGDLLYGFENDWENYINMAKWASENLPDSSYIACRKPGISFIYTGEKFYGIYRVEMEDPDELYKKVKDAGVTHFIIASLRTNPDVNNGRVITTLRRYFGPIQEKYPDRIRMIHSIGESEQAYLFEIK